MKTIYRNDLLKIIAMITMLVDHIGVMFYPEYRIFRTIGRIAFPIFAFYLAMGFRFTSNRQRYVKRLVVLALISQLPYIFLNVELLPLYLEFNVVFLFVYALGMLYCIEKATHSWQAGSTQKAILFVVISIIMIVLPEVLTQTIDGFYLSYGMYGLIMIILFYFLYDKPVRLLSSYVVFSLVFAYLYGVDILANYSDYTYIEALVQFKQIFNTIIDYDDGLRYLRGYFFQARSVLGVVCIIGLSTFSLDLKLKKSVAYVFYPLHMAVIVLIAYLIS